MPVPPLNTTEQVKLGATYLNTLAAGLVTIGVVAPSVLLLTTPEPVSDARIALLIGLALVCIIASVALHFTAQALVAVLLRNTDDQ